MSTSRIFGTPTPAQYARQGAAAQLALSHLSFVLSCGLSQLAKPALLGVLYETVCHLHFLLLQCSSLLYSSVWLIFRTSSFTSLTLSPFSPKFAGSWKGSSITSLRSSLLASSNDSRTAFEPWRITVSFDHPHASAFLADGFVATPPPSELLPLPNQEFKDLGWEARQAISAVTLSESFHDEPLGPSEFRDSIREGILAMATGVRSNLALWGKIVELSSAVSSGA